MALVDSQEFPIIALSENINNCFKYLKNRKHEVRTDSIKYPGRLKKIFFEIKKIEFVYLKKMFIEIRGFMFRYKYFFPSVGRKNHF